MRPNRQQSGFTLLELMVVIMIIGLSLGVVGLSVDGGNPQVEVVEEIEQFMGVANFASDRAILSGETMGLLLEPPLWQASRGESLDDIGWRYKWVTSSSEGWQDLPNIKTRSLPSDIELNIEVDDLLWDHDAHLDRATPIAAYYSSGDVTVIKIELTHRLDPDVYEVIEVDENGVLVWAGAPELPEGEEHGF